MAVPLFLNPGVGRCPHRRGPTRTEPAVHDAHDAVRRGPPGYDQPI